MKLNSTVKWYQTKIGQYDKEQWEESVEQRILNGIVQMPLKETRLKTELIDVDLVRGSSFPKAKPQQSLLTVLRLAVLRLIFLPIYARWWVQQTSRKIFACFLVLYLLKMVKWAIFSYNLHHKDTPDASSSVENSRCINSTELLITLALAFLLSVIHSQIVATTSITASCRKKRSRNLTQQRTSAGKDRIRRKRRTRPGSGTTNGGGREELNSTLHSNGHVGGLMTTTTRRSTNTASDQRQRNVNWDSPIKVHFDIGHQPIPTITTTTTEDALFDLPLSTSPTTKPCTSNLRRRIRRGGTCKGDDDGFESLNGKSSSGDESHLSEQVRMTGGDMVDGLVSDLPMEGVDEGLKAGVEDHPPPPQVHNKPKMTPRVGGVCVKGGKGDNSDTDEEREDELDLNLSSPGRNSSGAFTEGTNSNVEWCGVTTNSEELSYSSDLEHTDSQDFAPTVILSSNCGAMDRISCTIWDHRETKKTEMCVLDISSAIVDRVEAMPESYDYVYIGVFFSIVIAFVPTCCRIFESVLEASNGTDVSILDLPALLTTHNYEYDCNQILRFGFGEATWERALLAINLVLRLCLTCMYFFLLAVAERTFKQRFLYAKLFSHLTSSRRARKSKLPHFRLKSVRNIKTWLSVRSYLKRRGPQRSVDVIISSSFIVTLLLLAFLSVEWMKDSPNIHTQTNIEALIWSIGLGVFLLRFMTLGTKINRKYRSLSVIITEQINLYLQIEQKPNKKEELMVANSVLKLAADLLKELESPFKISGFSANPLLYTTVKVVILSALSGVLSEMLGFKLKLHKIKIK